MARELAGTVVPPRHMKVTWQVFPGLILKPLVTKNCR